MQASNCVATLSLSMLVLMLATPPAAAGTCRWWLEPAVQGALALRDDQVTAIGEEYNRTLTHRRLLRQEFETAHAEFTRALRRNDSSDAALEAMVSRVEARRQRRNVARTELLVALYFLLTPKQRVAFRELVQRGRPDVPARC
jgi:Spy/CpxP family protein refolding chaperone